LTGANVPTRRSGTVTGPERERLAADLGSLLRAERQDGGWTARELAARIGAAHTTVTRVERGERRPSRVLLRSLAHVLAYGNERETERLYSRLAAAAGPSLVVGTVAGERRRARRIRRFRQEVAREQAAADRAARERRQAEHGPRALKRIARAEERLTARLLPRLDRLESAIGSGLLSPDELERAEAACRETYRRLVSLPPDLFTPKPKRSRSHG
jgi:transcriptional regulator with XRE-family HTH domain